MDAKNLLFCRKYCWLLNLTVWLHTGGTCIWHWAHSSLIWQFKPQWPNLIPVQYFRLYGFTYYKNSERICSACGRKRRIATVKNIYIEIVIVMNSSTGSVPPTWFQIAGNEDGELLSHLRWPVQYSTRNPYLPCTEWSGTVSDRNFGVFNQNR